VRWYLRYSLSSREVQELLVERGLGIDHTTVWRWVQRYAPELEGRTRPHRKPTNKSWRVDETYVRVKGRWFYLCLANSQFLKFPAFRDACDGARTPILTTYHPAYTQSLAIWLLTLRHHGFGNVPPPTPPCQQVSFRGIRQLSVFGTGLDSEIAIDKLEGSRPFVRVRRRVVARLVRCECDGG
jgi:hypothetical protein